MVTLSDYSGRTIDILAFRGGQLNKRVQTTQNLADPGESGEICTGIQKLAQRFLLELLTVRGSMKAQPDRGCDFMQHVYGGQINTEADLFSAFVVAEVQAGINLRAEETDDDADDERYGVCRLIGITVSQGEAALSIRLQSRLQGATFVGSISIVV